MKPHLEISAALLLFCVMRELVCWPVLEQQTLDDDVSVIKDVLTERLWCRMLQGGGSFLSTLVTASDWVKTLIK